MIDPRLAPTAVIDIRGSVYEVERVETRFRWRVRLFRRTIFSAPVLIVRLREVATDQEVRLRDLVVLRHAVLVSPAWVTGRVMASTEVLIAEARATRLGLLRQRENS